jgi:hypothetical protein
MTKTVMAKPTGRTDVEPRRVSAHALAFLAGSCCWGVSLSWGRCWSAARCFWAEWTRT